MDELTYVFSTELVRLISKSFKGEVVVTGSCDELSIYVVNSVVGKEYKERNIAHQVKNGLTASFLAEKILKDIKRTVLKSCFHKIPVTGY